MNLREYVVTDDNNGYPIQQSQFVNGDVQAFPFVDFSDWSTWVVYSRDGGVTWQTGKVEEGFES